MHACSLTFFVSSKPLQHRQQERRPSYQLPVSAHCDDILSLAKQTSRIAFLLEWV
jgi:hypothetical protein